MKIANLSFTEFENLINNINPDPGPETYIHNEIKAKIGQMKDDAEAWEQPIEILYNLLDEENDGAYLPNETDEPFNHTDLKEFFFKYQMDLSPEVPSTHDDDAPYDTDRLYDDDEPEIKRLP